MVSAKARRKLLRVHRWLGIHLAVLMFMLCATGTLAVFGHELDWLLDPAQRADPAAMDWQAADATLRETLPDHELQSLTAPVAPGFAATAFVVSPSGQLQRALIDPGDGSLQAVRHVVTAQVYLRNLHRHLMVPKGLLILSLLGVVLAFSAISGLLVYPQWWRKLTRLRLRAPPTVRRGDLHRTFGVWASLFALVIAVTSIWYWGEAAARTFAGVHVDRDAPQLAVAEAERPADAELASSAELVAAAEQAMPDLEIRMIMYPMGLRDAVRIDGRRPQSPWLRNRANRVYLDPYSAQVVELRRVESASLLLRWSDLADELHFGTFGSYGGLWSKTLYFLLGLLLSAVVLAGPALALARQRARKQPAKSQAGPGPSSPPRDPSRSPSRSPSRNPSRSRARTWWLRLAVAAAAVITGLLLVAFVVFTYLAQSQPLLTGRGEADVSSAVLEYEGHDYVLSAHRSDETATYVLRWLDGPPASLRKVSLAMSDGPAGDEAEPRELAGFRSAVRAAAWSEQPTLVFEGSSGEPLVTRIEWSSPGSAMAPGPYERLDARRTTLAFIWAAMLGFFAASVAAAALLWRPLQAASRRRRTRAGEPSPDAS